MEKLADITIPIEIDGEELALLAAVCWRNLDGRHPARERLSKGLFQCFEEVTGVNINRVPGWDTTKFATDIFEPIERAMNGELGR